MIGNLLVGFTSPVPDRQGRIVELRNALRIPGLKIVFLRYE